MAILIRKHAPNKDKLNVTKDELQQGLDILGKTESDIYLRVKWLHIEDIFFRDTKDYIRLIHPKDYAKVNSL